MEVKKILLDMDGVLVNYDKQVDTMNIRKETGKTNWDLARKIGPKFWAEMEWMPEGKKFYNDVVEFANANGLEVGILSAIFLNEGKWGKITWLKNNIPEMKVGNIILNDRGSLKYQVLPKDCVLVDDNAENVENCFNNGLKAILYTDAAETIENIRKFFNA